MGTKHIGKGGDTVSTEDLARALRIAQRHVFADVAVKNSEHSAGFIVAPGQQKGERVGLQVCVKVYRWSERRQKENPLSGGRS